MGRYDLSDAHFALVKPELPTNNDKTGHPEWEALAALMRCMSRAPDGLGKVRGIIPASLKERQAEP
jgi:hypothetical protein